MLIWEKTITATYKTFAYTCMTSQIKIQNISMVISNFKYWSGGGYMGVNIYKNSLNLCTLWFVQFTVCKLLLGLKKKSPCKSLCLSNKLRGNLVFDTSHSNHLTHTNTYHRCIVFKKKLHLYIIRSWFPMEINHIIPFYYRWSCITVTLKYL